MRSPRSWVSQWVNMLRCRSMPVASENGTCSRATTTSFFAPQESLNKPQLDYVDASTDIMLAGFPRRSDHGYRHRLLGNSGCHSCALDRRRWACWELGVPTGHSFTTANESGFGQHFQSVEIYGTDSLGAHSIQSPILDGWDAAGREDGTYGYPAEEQSCTETDCSQAFESGTVSVTK